VGDVSTKTRPAPEEAARLYREHGRAIRAYLRARVGDDAAVDDLLQDTFLTALRQGIPEGPPGPWLFGIARHKALKHRDRRQAQGLGEALTPAAQAEPVEGLDRDERRLRIRGSIAALPEDQRAVIALRYTGGLSYPEIAARLDVPVSTVQGRLKRARQALRKRLMREVAP
jgi:RNA polymerase sigma-70 factor (ECF subfamily)